MIKKKCRDCGTLHSADHVGECIVDGGSNFFFTCDKHDRLELTRYSECQECIAEEEARKRAREAHNKPPVLEPHCPRGHGPLREWQGKMRCWTCGWISDAPPPLRSPEKRTASEPRSYLKPHRGGTILALGILSIFCLGCFSGLPAWFMGKHDLTEMDKGIMDSSGRGFTNTGKIIGQIISILWIIYFVGIILAG